MNLIKKLMDLINLRLNNNFKKFNLIAYFQIYLMIKLYKK